MDWRQKCVLLMTIAIFMTRVGMGYQLSITGQNILYFTRNINVSVATLSFAFMAGALGMIVGSLAAAGLKRKYPIRQFYIMGTAAAVYGLNASATPWITTFWMFILCYVLCGISYGLLETGLTTLILELIRGKESRFHIHLFHLNSAIGSFIGPLIARSLIQSGKIELKHDIGGCNRNISRESIRHVNSSDYSVFSKPANLSSSTSSFNGNAWSYHVLTFWMILPASIIIFLGIKNIEGNILDDTNASDGSSPRRKKTKRADAPLKSVFWIVFGMTGFYAGVTAMDRVVQIYIYPVAVCSEMSFTMTNAALVNSLIWFGGGLGRLVATVLETHVPPIFMIYAGITVSSLSCVVMSVFGQSHSWISWGWSGLFGLSVSVLYPSGISWISRKVSVTGIYMFVFTLGGKLGSLIFIPLAGAVFEIDNFFVIHVATGLCLFTGVIFLLSRFAASGRKDGDVGESPEQENSDKQHEESAFSAQRRPVHVKELANL